MFLAGVDEAGRGPVLGPLVIAGVVIKEEALNDLITTGLTDSKLLTAKSREKLFQKINEMVEDFKIIIIPADEIDSQKKAGVNLNTLEFNKIVEILNSLSNWECAFVDACDTNAERFEEMLKANINSNVVAEHFADKKYPVVSAASILAKVTRDNEIKKAQEDYKEDIGSGYPSDQKTIDFLKKYYSKNGSLPNIARMSWETSKKIIREQEQSNLDDFFSNKS